MSTNHLTSIEQLSNQLNWDEFSISTPDGNTLTANNFELIAVGYPNREKEKWDMDTIDPRYDTQEDLIYALVIDGKLLKLGKSITTMKKRVSSYHCGKNSYRQKPNATNSATNWFILQSVLAIGLPVEIYALFIPQTQGEFMGWTYHNRVSKEVEGRLLSAFCKKYGYRPIGNIQK